MRLAIQMAALLALAAAADASEEAELDALGYLPATEAAPAHSGVRRHDAARAWKGLNLYSSAHAAEAVLMDMDGNAVRRWTSPLPEYPAPARWRRVRALPDGSLLAVWEGAGLLKVDAESRLLWFHRAQVHHDVDVDAAGRIYTLTRTHRVEPRLGTAEAVLDDAIAVLSADGELLREISLVDSLITSEYFPALLGRSRAEGDILHTNTIRILGGAGRIGPEIFAPGRALVSHCFLDAVALVDLGMGRTVWMLGGLWREPHAPELLENGRLLVVDNRGGRGYSRVVEVDPLTQQVAWRYEDREGAGFYTRTCGAARRLPNGNTLIVETDRGRAFEAADGGEIVWEFVSPHRLTVEGGERIAKLYDLERLPMDYFRP